MHRGKVCPERGSDSRKDGPGPERGGGKPSTDGRTYVRLPLTHITVSPRERVTVPSAFEQAAIAAGNVQTAQPAAAGPVRNAMPVDQSNPFANPTDFGGGAFTPTPTMDVLVGRTLVYIPRSFDPAAKDPFNVGQTRKQWTADLYVIDGGELRFWYKQKGNLNAVPPTQDTTVEQVVENVTPQTPYVCLGTWVSQAAFVPKLTGAADRGQILIGTPVRGAQKAQRDKGATDESVRQDYAGWLARGKSGPEPKYLWLLNDVTPEGMANVQTWWAAHKDSIKL